MDKSYYCNQDNELIEATYSLSKDEMRLILIALSKIDSKKPQPNNPYIITPCDFSKLTGDKNHSYSKLIDAAIKLNRNPIKIFSKTKKLRKLTKEHHWFDMIEYDEDATHLSYRFSSYVEPFLFDLKASFTKMRLDIAAKLNNHFDVRLYAWLLKNEKIGKNKLSKTKELVLTKEYVLEKSGMLDCYQDFRSFKQGLIDRTVKRLNELTEYSIATETIKEGRKATGIKFTYIVESVTKSNSSKLQLPKRPQVKAGTHAEGEYFNLCIKTLLDYEKENGELEKKYAEKLISFFLKSGNKFAADDYRIKYNLQNKRG